MPRNWKNALIWTTGAFLYLIRPWTCGHALAQLEKNAQLPHAHFDPHGFLGVSSWLIALLFIWPIAHLISPVLQNEDRGAASINKPTRMMVMGSSMVALIIAAPSHAQICYVIVLPISLTWPILMSAISWAGFVASLFTMLHNRHDAATVIRKSRVSAGIVTTMILVPKLMLLVPFLLDFS